MVTEESTFVFDFEFAFVGPMGFDLGALLANLFLAYFSKEGQTNTTEAYKQWLLELVE
jgi:5-methylthioribose kinase